jgi:monofunctional biosynthetic peptidoglycan transglycosylase
VAQKTQKVQKAQRKIVANKPWKKPRWHNWVLRIIAVVAGIAFLYHGTILYRVFRLRNANPTTTALMEQRAEEAAEQGSKPKKNQIWVPYERISPNLARAVLAGEDNRFFDHAGFDWDAIQKAIEEDWEEKEFRRGASTISQQLAKNLFLSTSKNPLRKLHETLITWEMERIVSKRRILEVYLNVIEWGDGIYGAEAAARHYFNAPAASLSTEQAAFLSAIIPNPRGKYNPTTNPRRVERRKRIILRLMRHVVIPKELD